MRLRINLYPEGHSLRLPVQYNHLVQGLIYSNLDHALSEWLHEKGHASGARRFKLFTFSRLFGKRQAENGRIRFDGPVHFYLGAVDTEVLGSLAEHLLQKPSVRGQINEALCKLHCHNLCVLGPTGGVTLGLCAASYWLSPVEIYRRS